MSAHPTPASVRSRQWDMEMAQARQESDEIRKDQVVSIIHDLMRRHQITIERIAAPRLADAGGHAASATMSL